MEALETDNEEQQSINEGLLLELEKRDVAIQQAVNMICELEAKIEDMEMIAAMDIRPSLTIQELEPRKQETQDAASPSTTSDVSRTSKDVSINPQSQPPPEISPSRVDTLSPNTAEVPRRVPSFLRDTRKSTNVLRSLYSTDEIHTNENLSSISLPRAGSLFSGEDDDDYLDRQTMNSPRLSILSESGFSSVYGNRKDQLLSPPLEDNGREDCIDEDNGIIPERSSARTPSRPVQRDNQREARLHKWLGERDRPTTPTRTSPKAAAQDHFSSISEVLNHDPNPTPGQQRAENSLPDQDGRENRSPEKFRRKQARSSEKRSMSPSFGGPIFGESILPPTPDTMSTMTLARNSSTPSVVTEKSLLDSGPLPAKRYLSLAPEGRPLTSDSDCSDVRGIPRVSSFTTGKSMRELSHDMPTRPPLTTYATDTMYKGEGSSPTHASRTLSYSSPTGRSRRGSNQLSPTSSRSSAGERHSNLSPQDWMSASSATVTPIKRNPKEVQHRSPPASQAPETPSPADKTQRTETDARLQRSSSLRSKVANKISLTPSQSPHQSVASRLFRRSNSQSVQKPVVPRSNSPFRPQVTRAASSTHQRRLPRPASLYGQNLPPRFHPAPRPVYELSPLLPDGMLTDLDRYSPDSSRHRGQRPERRGYQLPRGKCEEA